MLGVGQHRRCAGGVGRALQGPGRVEPECGMLPAAGSGALQAAAPAEPGSQRRAGLLSAGGVANARRASWQGAPHRAGALAGVFHVHQQRQAVWYAQRARRHAALQAVPEGVELGVAPILLHLARVVGPPGEGEPAVAHLRRAEVGGGQAPGRCCSLGVAPWRALERVRPWTPACAAHAALHPPPGSVQSGSPRSRSGRRRGTTCRRRRRRRQPAPPPPSPQSPPAQTRRRTAQTPLLAPPPAPRRRAAARRWDPVPRPRLRT